jgi:hypothetical protein
MPTGQSRATVYPGDPLVVWNTAGDLPPFTHEWHGDPTYQLVGGGGASVPLLRRAPWDSQNEAPFDPTYHGEILIPADARPGQYMLAAGPVTFAVKVVARRAPAGRHRLNPGATVAEAQKWLKKDYDLVLDPGEYRWGRSVFPKSGDAADLPLKADGATITGPGAVIVPDPDVKPPETNWYLAGFFSAAGATLDGLAFDLPGGRAVGSVYSPGLTMRRCRLLDTALNEPGAGVYLEGCEVTGRGAGVYLTAGGLVRRTNFHDTTDAHPFNCGRSAGDLALVGCRFVRVGRGPLFQPQGGGFRGVLGLGTALDSIRSYNGSESWAVENGSDTPYSFDDALILHTLSDTEGSSIQWDGPATGNVVRDFTCRRGLGFRLWGQGVTGNTFDGYTLGNGAGIELAAGSMAANTFRNGPLSPPAVAGTMQGCVDVSGFGVRPTPVEGGK